LYWIRGIAAASRSPSSTGASVEVRSRKISKSWRVELKRAFLGFRLPLDSV
jgi:hypothetical protein